MELYMIKFDPAKVTFEYVYIRKIFKNFVEVICDNDGNKYESETVSFKRLKDGSVQIPIHYKVYSLYLKRNSLLHFDEKVGKKACILFYDGKVLTIDVYRKSYFEKNIETQDKWTSANEGVVSIITDMLKVNDTAYIDGESIFFLDKLKPIIRLKTNIFWYQPVRYIELSKMGIKKANSELLSKIEDKEEKEKEKNSYIILKDGYTLAFKPNIIGTEISEEIIVYSPVFGNEITKSKPKSRRVEDFNKPFTPTSFFSQINKIEDTANPNIMNLDFVLKAAKVIGSHYSFEDTDFLDIPKIILETGILNLKYDISRESRAKYPVAIKPFEGLAYIYRYLYMENDLNVYRDLVSLFNFTIKYGFVSKKDTTELFVEGKSQEDIKTFNLKQFMKEKSVKNLTLVS
jgi:hypothetical protein